MAKFPLYQMKDNQAHINEFDANERRYQTTNTIDHTCNNGEQSKNHKSGSKLNVHGVKNPAQDAKSQKIDVRKTQGRRSNGIPKVFGAMATATINRVERIPNHFKIRRLENMTSPSVFTLGVSR